MSNSVQPKNPTQSFVILAVTLLLGGLFTLGGFVALYFYFPDPTTMVAARFLAINGLICWLLAILCALSAWRFFKGTANARSFAKKTWVLVAVFTLWILSFDGFQGWSAGGVVEVVVWGALETIIGIYLLRTREQA